MRQRLHAAEYNCKTWRVTLVIWDEWLTGACVLDIKRGDWINEYLSITIHFSWFISQIHNFILVRNKLYSFLPSCKLGKCSAHAQKRSMISVLQFPLIFNESLVFCPQELEVDKVSGFVKIICLPWGWSSQWFCYPDLSAFRLKYLWLFCLPDLSASSFKDLPLFCLPDLYALRLKDLPLFCLPDLYALRLKELLLFCLPDMSALR